MGFSYRKSFKAGPFRVTASKSGISYSVGVKGARVTKRAKGGVQTTLSVPGSGLRYTTTSGTAKKATKTSKSTGTMVVRPSVAARPQAPKPRVSGRLAVEEAWRNTGLPLPPHSPDMKPRKAMLIAGIVTVLREPGEEIRLIIAINKVSPTRDALVVTSHRLLLFHTREIRRTGKVFTVRLDSLNEVTVRKRFGSASLIVRYSGTVHEVCGGVRTKCLDWLRYETAPDPMFMLAA